MCGMCQAHLPTPEEGRRKGPGEGRGEGRGSLQPEKTCLFSGSRPSLYLLASLCSGCCAQLLPTGPVGLPPERTCSPNPPVPQAGRLYQVGVYSHRWKDTAYWEAARGTQFSQGLGFPTKTRSTGRQFPEFSAFHRKGRNRGRGG